MLAQLGWDETWATLAALHRPYGTPARVARADTDPVLIHTDRGEVRTVLPAGMTLVTGGWVRTCSTGECRFGDCRHAGEPGCAVAAAVAAGTPSAGRVASHAKLEREVAWLRDRYDARLRAEQRRRRRKTGLAKRSGPRR